MIPNKLNNLSTESNSLILQMLRKLISQLSPPLEESIIELDETGWNLFHYCCFYNSVLTVSKLINLGFPINDRTSEGYH